MPQMIIVIVLIIVLLIILASSLRIVPQAHAYVIERLGAYKCTWSVGFHAKVPIIDKVAKRVVLKEQVIDFPPKSYTYNIQNPIVAIENLTATTLRNIIGDLELDETLTSREIINTKMRATLDVATDPWGIKVNRVELKNIIPPTAIRDAMEKQMKAERERREQILIAEGEKKSSILKAEGLKQSMILRAEADKQSQILRAQAVKEAKIVEAEGEAEAIIKVQKANADGLRYLKEAGADEAVLKLKSYEAFTAAANGKATKIIVPSEIQSLAGLAEAVVESVKDPQPEKSEPESTETK